MVKSSDKRSAIPDQRWPRLFALFFGGFLGISLLKFGNPALFDQMVGRPQGFLEVLVNPWPISWAYMFLGIITGIACLVVSGTFGWKPPQLPRTDRFLRRILWLLEAWIVWQFIAAQFSVRSELTMPTVFYFVTCVICFALGLLVLSRVPTRAPFWIALTLSFAVVLWFGLDQKFGGLEATRREFYSQPNWQSYPLAFIKRVESNRIFSTLFYPNTLAGGILLLFPTTAVGIWLWTGRWPRMGRMIILGCWLFAGLGCLFWTGSKAGWLIAIVVSAVWFWLQPFSQRLKVWVAIVLVVGGVSGFFIRFAPYFRKGATSVGARMDYWTAALKTSRDNPAFGSGPGTFAVSYGRIIPANAEMARMVHNDYLEQASDSGWVGAIAYAGFVWTCLLYVYQRRDAVSTPLFLPIWLGLFGWSIHAFVEFPLYIPGLAWTAFSLFGLVLAQAQNGRQGVAELKSTEDHGSATVRRRK
jgi:hypothetical protein